MSRPRKVIRVPFVGDVNLRALRDSKWLLLDPVTYHGNPDHGGDAWTIPADFTTDLASVPSCFVWAVARYGRVTTAALLHDYLCLLARAKLFNRRDADGILRRVLREVGVPRVTAYLMWAAVRVGSHLTGATRRERAQIVGIGLLALPLLLFSLLLVWPAQRLFRLVERA